MFHEPRFIVAANPIDKPNQGQLLLELSPMKNAMLCLIS